MFLKRGGRVDAATTALVGTVLQIKPVMHMDDAGTLKNVTKARGRRPRSRPSPSAWPTPRPTRRPDRLHLPRRLPGRCGVHRRADPRAGPGQDIIINYVGPVIGAHTGPGVISIFFVGTHR